MEPWRATNNQRVTRPDNKKGKLEAHDTMLLTGKRRLPQDYHAKKK
jgi:hypothetical protein